MAEPSPIENLLARLAGHTKTGGPDPWATVAATRPAHETEVRKNPDIALEDLVRRIQEIKPGLTKSPLSGGGAASSVKETAAAVEKTTFVPHEPTSFLEAELTESEVEALVLKLLQSRGEATGRFVAEHVRLPFLLIDGLMRQMKQDQLVVHKGAATMNDYVYQLTEFGRERARRLPRIALILAPLPFRLKTISGA